MHGGHVRVDSPGVGQGATFSVELPLAAEAAEPPERRRRARELAPELLVVLKNARILVVDDETDARDLMVRLLSGVGAEITAAASVAEGLRVIRHDAPDLVISDIGMPHADGYELLRKLRLMGDAYARTPVIAVTAYAREEDRQRALAAGFQAHIGKPFEVQALLGIAAALISKMHPD
jgi:CheY-like chemotaxis protein